MSATATKDNGENKLTMKGEPTIDNVYQDIAFRFPVKLVFEKHPRCPKCGTPLLLRVALPSWFPYIHVDLTMQCGKCDTKYVFGIPQSNDAGLSLIIYDTNPLDTLKEMSKLDTPQCPWRHGDMLPTKIFGDWVNGDTIRYQWKCPTCYLVHHETVNRTIEHKLGKPLTSEEEEQLKGRMKRLGYLE